MPRTKKTKTGHMNHEKRHVLELDQYHIGEHVTIMGHVGRDSTCREPKQFIVKIMDLFYSQTGAKRFTAKYYYSPSDLPKAFAVRIPEICGANEIFVSNFTAENALETIVSKCQVYDRPYPSSSSSTTYVCRYQFFPWNLAKPFASVVESSPRVHHAPSSKESDRPIGTEFQAEVPDLAKLELRSADPQVTGDQSTHIWSPSISPNLAVESFLVLYRSLMFAVGNVVFAWQKDIREEVRCAVAEHLKNGQIKVHFADESGSEEVEVAFVRGVIREDEALEMLYTTRTIHGLFDYPNALVKLVRVLMQRNQYWKDKLLSDREKSLSGTRPGRRGRKRKRKPSDADSARSTRKASMVALQKIFSIA